jgi:hypothetical protein
MRPTQNGQPVLGFWVPGCWRSGGSTIPPRVDFLGSRGSLRELGELGELQPADGMEIKLSIFVQPDSWWIVLALLHYLPSGSCKLDDVSLVRLLRPFFTDRVLSIFTRSCGRSTDFFLRLSLSLEHSSSSIHHHSSINLLHKVTRLAFWRSGRAERRPVAKPWSWDAAHTTRENREREVGSACPKTKTRSAAPCFVCSGLASKQPRFIEGVKPRPARCKAAAGVQGRGGAGARGRGGAGARSGKVHARGRGRAVPTHTMGAFQLVTGARRAQHPQLWQTPYSTYHWQCAHGTSYWLSTPCFFLLSPFPSFPSSPPHVLRALSAPPPSRYSSPIRTAADSGDSEARLRGAQLQASRHKIENQLVSPPYKPVPVTVTVPPADCSPIRLLSDASGL